MLAICDGCRRWVWASFSEWSGHGRTLVIGATATIANGSGGDGSRPTYGWIHLAWQGSRVALNKKLGGCAQRYGVSHVLRSFEVGVRVNVSSATVVLLVGAGRP